MTRHKGDSRHPAIVGAISREMDGLVDDLANEVPGWDGFSPSEKFCIVVRPFCRSNAEAAQYVGRSKRWVYDRSMSNPEFSQAMKISYINMVTVAQRIWKEMLGPATMGLIKMMQGDLTVEQRINVTKLLAQLSGATGGGTKASAQLNIFNDPQVPGFSGIKGAPRSTVLEAEGGTVDNSDD